LTSRHSRAHSSVTSSRRPAPSLASPLPHSSAISPLAAPSSNSASAPGARSMTQPASPTRSPPADTASRSGLWRPASSVTTPSRATPAARMRKWRAAAWRVVGRVVHRLGHRSQFEGRAQAFEVESGEHVDEGDPEPVAVAEGEPDEGDALDPAVPPVGGFEGEGEGGLGREPRGHRVQVAGAGDESGVKVSHAPL
jgi:hypothetical protein